MKKFFLFFLFIVAIVIVGCGNQRQIQNLQKMNNDLTVQITNLEKQAADLKTNVSDLETDNQYLRREIWQRDLLLKRVVSRLSLETIRNEIATVSFYGEGSKDFYHLSTTIFAVGSEETVLWTKTQMKKFSRITDCYGNREWVVTLH